MLDQKKTEYPKNEIELKQKWYFQLNKAKELVHGQEGQKSYGMIV